MRRREESWSPVPVLFGAATVLACCSLAFAQQEPAVDKAVTYLRSHSANRQVGETAKMIDDGWLEEALDERHKL